jgi:hypothetical protein
MFLFSFFSVCFETDVFVSVVSKRIRNTETNRKKPKKCFISFAKQTENQTKQIEFRFVSVRTEIFFCLFRGHPSFCIKIEVKNVFVPHQIMSASLTAVLYKLGKELPGTYRYLYRYRYLFILLEDFEIGIHLCTAL